MPCYDYYIAQDLYSYGYINESIWDGCQLDTPVLFFPPDNIQLCNGQSSGVVTFDLVLEWLPVAGAEFYVLEIAQNTDFIGPDVRAYVVYAPTTTYTFSDSDFRQGEQYVWRVSAVDGTTTFGCHSLASEPRTFTKVCVLQFVGARDQDPDISDKNKCDLFNVTVQIQGQSKIDCCDCAQYFANVGYNCSTPFGGDLISVDSLAWNIRANPGQDPPVILGAVGSPDSVFVCPPQDGDSQEAIIDLCVVFNDLVNGGTFICCDHKNIEIQCEEPTKSNSFGVVASVDVSQEGLFNGGPGIQLYFPVGNPASSANTDPNPTGTDLPDFGAGSVAILSGPIVFSPTVTSTGNSGYVQVDVGAGVASHAGWADPLLSSCDSDDNASDDDSDQATIPGAPKYQAFARVALPVGCGLVLEDGELQVDIDTLIKAGDNITFESDGCYRTIHANVDTELLEGCGIYIGPGGTINFDSTVIGAGDGIDIESVGECGLVISATPNYAYVYTYAYVDPISGCGIYIEPDGTINFDSTVIGAGAGIDIESVGDCELIISATPNYATSCLNDELGTGFLFLENGVCSLIPPSYCPEEAPLPPEEFSYFYYGVTWSEVLSATGLFL